MNLIKLILASLFLTGAASAQTLGVSSLYSPLDRGHLANRLDSISYVCKTEGKHFDEVADRIWYGVDSVDIGLSPGNGGCMSPWLLIGNAHVSWCMNLEGDNCDITIYLAYPLEPFYMEFSCEDDVLIEFYDDPLGGGAGVYIWL